MPGATLPGSGALAFGRRTERRAVARCVPRFWMDGRVQLWREKLGLAAPFAGNAATEWGNRNEEHALRRRAPPRPGGLQSGAIQRDAPDKALGSKEHGRGRNAVKWLPRLHVPRHSGLVTGFKAQRTG